MPLPIYASPLKILMFRLAVLTTVKLNSAHVQSMIRSIGPNLLISTEAAWDYTRIE